MSGKTSNFTRVAGFWNFGGHRWPHATARVGGMARKVPLVLPAGSVPCCRRNPEKAMAGDELDVIDEKDVVGFTDAPSVDETRTLAEMGQELFSLDREKADIKKRLEEIESRRQVLTMRELPEYMTRVGSDNIGLPEFNADVVMEDYYHANIAADWEPERRQKAFDWLEKNGHGDLIKTEFSIMFPRFMLPVARWLQEHVKTLRPVLKMTVLSGKKKVMKEQEFEIPEADVNLTVPWNTLTAFVKEQVTKGAKLPLDTLGATVGKIVKIKPR